MLSSAVVGGIIVALIGVFGAPYGLLMKRVMSLESRLDKMERRERRQDTLIRSHTEWDSKVLAALPPETAASLGPIPPLYPIDEDED